MAHKKNEVNRMQQLSGQFRLSNGRKLTSSKLIRSNPDETSKIKVAMTNPVTVQAAGPSGDKKPVNTKVDTKIDVEVETKASNKELMARLGLAGWPQPKGPIKVKTLDEQLAEVMVLEKERLAKKQSRLGAPSQEAESLRNAKPRSRVTSPLGTPQLPSRPIAARLQLHEIETKTSNKELMARLGLTGWPQPKGPIKVKTLDEQLAEVMMLEKERLAKKQSRFFPRNQRLAKKQSRFFPRNPTAPKSLLPSEPHGSQVGR